MNCFSSTIYNARLRQWRRQENHHLHDLLNHWLLYIVRTCSCAKVPFYRPFSDIGNRFETLSPSQWDIFPERVATVQIKECKTDKAASSLWPSFTVTIVQFWNICGLLLKTKYLVGGIPFKVWSHDCFPCTRLAVDHIYMLFQQVLIGHQNCILTSYLNLIQT